MTQPPVLSIVTPTLGQYSDTWFQAMCQVNGVSTGEIEHVLAYPPGVAPSKENYLHIREVVCTEKGGTLQRYCGLLNARGQFIICIDDDDYLHPNILDTVKGYFDRFPESWLLRLRKSLIPAENKADFLSPWPPIPDVRTLPVETSFNRDAYTGLLVNPIAPLKHHFKLKYLFSPYRKTGLFTENFNNTVWSGIQVRAALPKFAAAMDVLGPIKWHPASGCERFFGLFIQADQYDPQQPKQTIGHTLPSVPQVRFAKVDPVFKKPRFHIFGDLLLLVSFPQYDYFWSRASAHIFDTPRAILKALRWKISPPKKAP